MRGGQHVPDGRAGCEEPHDLRPTRLGEAVELGIDRLSDRQVVVHDSGGDRAIDVELIGDDVDVLALDLTAGRCAIRDRAEGRGKLEAKLYFAEQGADKDVASIDPDLDAVMHAVGYGVLNIAEVRIEIERARIPGGVLQTLATKEQEAAVRRAQRRGQCLDLAANDEIGAER